MPYASKAQQRFAHTPTAQKQGFPTAEFDHATRDYNKLPERAPGRAPTAAKKQPSSRVMRGRR